MPNLKKIFLATRTPESFDFLTGRFGESFSMTRDYREADLVILDLANPLDHLNWVSQSSTHFFAGPCCPPFLLAALGAPPDPDTLRTVKSVFPESGRVHRQREELEETLAWVDSVFPFYNLRNLRNAELDRMSSDMVVQHMKREDILR